MLIPSRRVATMPRSASRCSWLETACGFIPIDAARSVTRISSARTKACRSRSRVSLASTLKTEAKPPAWIGDRSGRSFKAMAGQHGPASFPNPLPSFPEDLFLISRSHPAPPSDFLQEPSFDITLICVIVTVNCRPDAKGKTQPPKQGMAARIAAFFLKNKEKC